MNVASLDSNWGDGVSSKGTLSISSSTARRPRTQTRSGWMWIVFTQSGKSMAISCTLYRASCDSHLLCSCLNQMFSTCLLFQGCRTGIWDAGGIFVISDLYTLEVTPFVHLFSRLQRGRFERTFALGCMLRSFGQTPQQCSHLLGTYSV